MLSLRRANPADARAIAEVHIQSWKETYPEIISGEILNRLTVDGSEKNWIENLAEGPPHFQFTYVAGDANKKIVGFASGSLLRRELGEDLLPDYDCELQAIYLAKDFQRTGAGRVLFNAVVAELARRGYMKMAVWVLKENPACAFYEHIGGKLVAEKKIQMGDWKVEIAYGWDKFNSI